MVEKDISVFYHSQLTSIFHLLGAEEVKMEVFDGKGTWGGDDSEGSSPMDQDEEEHQAHNGFHQQRGAQCAQQ